MRIDRLELFLCRLPLVHFFETSFGRSYDREFILARRIERIVIEQPGRSPRVAHKIVERQARRPQVEITNPARNQIGMIVDLQRGLARHAETDHGRFPSDQRHDAPPAARSRRYPTVAFTILSGSFTGSPFLILSTFSIPATTLPQTV